MLADLPEGQGTGETTKDSSWRSGARLVAALYIAVILLFGVLFLVSRWWVLRNEAWGSFVSMGSEVAGVQYLLSSEAQVLGAVLALVVAVTLAGAAVAVRYTWRILSILLGPWLLLYAVPYIAFIVLPLVLLTSTPLVWQVRLRGRLGSWTISGRRRRYPQLESPRCLRPLRPGAATRLI